MHRPCLGNARECEVDDGKEKKNSSDCLVPTHFRRMRNVERVMCRWLCSQREGTLVKNEKKKGILSPQRRKRGSKLGEGYGLLAGNN
jgi:hypothetical protein